MARGAVSGTGAGDRGVYIISVAAELTGVHPQTLRIYERRGLIVPDRTKGGSRRYSERDIHTLRRIQELTALGLSLTGVERMLALEQRLGQAEAEIQRLRDRIGQMQDEHRQALERVHRTYRRDLVPVRRDLVLWRRP